jgi:hypothetical protein
MASKTPSRPKAKTRRSPKRAAARNSRQSTSAPRRTRSAAATASRRAKSPARTANGRRAASPPAADVSPAVRKEWQRLTQRWQKLLPRLGHGATKSRRRR